MQTGVYIFLIPLLSAVIVFGLYRRCLLDRMRTVLGYGVITLLALFAMVPLLLRFRAASPVQIVAIELGVIFCITGALVLFMFYRDPDRRPPAGDHAILSPADGIIRYIRRIESGVLPVADKKGRVLTLEHLAGGVFQMDSCWQIGIEMNLLDVHVNRIPVGGTVRTVLRLPGKYLSLRDPLAMGNNARVTTVIDTERFPVAVIQISSRLVRSISNRCCPGESVRKGDRFGAIRFGSQVDILFPELPNLKRCVHLGERVRAGETVIANDSD